MAAVWIVIVVIGLAVAMLASRRAVRHASALAFGTRIPPFVIGVTLVAVGTDLPEIANSIIASAAGHGDLNVGDSVGSAATQVTLVLGLLPFLAAGVAVSKRSVLAAGGMTALSLGVLALLVADGRLQRGDGLVLIVLWIVTSGAVWRLSDASLPALEVPARSRGYHAAAAVAMLAVVGGGAGAAVAAFIELAELLGVSEYIIAFFATSLGTSLPELFVDVTALRRGERDIAIGDAFGSSLVDASLSVGIGPAMFPVAVTAGLAARGAIIALAAVAVVTLVLARRGRLDRISGLIAVLAYATLYPLLLA